LVKWLLELNGKDLQNKKSVSFRINEGQDNVGVDEKTYITSNNPHCRCIRFLFAPNHHLLRSSKWH